MKRTEDKTKPDSSRLQRKIRKAEFVVIDSKLTKKLKYICNLKSIYTKLCHSIRTNFNRVWQVPKEHSKLVDWKTIFRDALYWIGEAAVEGLTANFATHYLFGVSFSVPMVLAHGMIIKQSLSIYWRLKQDGQPATIQEAND